ncbi:MAG: Trk system potassium transporter TrkA [Clostridiales bacterium]|nr:Trk system potassium transporter TrkA [Clostridiales bacterium]
MNLIIVGAGKVGETLIENFLKESHDITVLDVNASEVSSIVDKLDVKGVVGSGIERDSLINAGVESADFFIACTSRDETNILCCVLAKKLGAKRTIARVRDPEYFKEVDGMKEDLGLDFAFNPELHTALEIAQQLKFPSARGVETFVKNRVTMAEYEIADGNPLIGKSLKDISGEFGNKVLIAVVQRGKEFFIPRGDFVINLGDLIHIIAKEAEINAFCKKTKLYKRRAKNIFIVGGGKITYYLALELIKSGLDVKIIENDEGRAQVLAGALPKATVILGDGTDNALLDEENIKGADACVTLTGIDEENVIVSLYAKQKGVGKVITKIDRSSIVSMVERIGLDAVVSPKDIIANQIVSFVRAHQAETGNGINTLYKLDDKVEALVFTVRESFGKQGVPLKKLSIKRNVLIGGIVRGNEFVFPTGESCLLAGDRVIVVTAAKQVTDLTQILR